MGLNINFLDKKDSIKKASSDNYNRKIKFRLLSFEKISSIWKKTKMNILEKKLEAQKENFVSMGFDDREINSSEREKTEEKIMKKTKAIAKLESRLTFLKIGKYNSEKFINSRAIKLKDIMMNNLVFNRDCQYSLREDAANQIIEEDYIDDEVLKKALEDEMTKIGNKVKEIMEENLPKTSDVPVQDVNSDNIASSVDSEFSKKEALDIDEIRSIIDQSIEQQEVTPSSDKVNKFINDDGTYRLKKEDIDEEFRITRFDTKKPVKDEVDSDMQEQTPNIEPFSTEQTREIPEIGLPKRAVTEIIDKKHDFAIPAEVEVVQEEQTREMPLVVPERQAEEKNIDKEYSDDIQPLDMLNTEKKQTTGEKNIDPLMIKVNILQAEKETIRKKAEEEENRAEQVNRTYQETIEKLSKYAELLEADCNKDMETVQMRRAESDEKEEKINAMLEMMSSMDIPTVEVRKGK